MTPIRKQLHQMINNLPEEILINAYWSLNNIKKHQALLLHINSLPIYDMGTPEDMKELVKQRQCLLNKNDASVLLHIQEAY